MYIQAEADKELTGKGNRAHLFLKMFLMLLFVWLSFRIVGTVPSTAASLQVELGHG